MTKVFITLAILSAFILSGCPHLMKDQIEKINKESKRKKTTFLKSSVPISQIGKFNGIDSVKNISNGSTKILSNGSTKNNAKTSLKLDSNDSTGSDTKSIAIADSNSLSNFIDLEIRAIDTKDYPDSVILKAVVFDTSGRYITNMAPPYFKGKGNYHDYWVKLTDSCGNSIDTYRDFTVSEIREDASEPYSMAFVLDHSPSMGQKKATMLQKSIKLVSRAIKKGDYVSIIKFSSEIFVEIPLTNDPRQYRGIKVEGIPNEMGGGTALFDAAIEGINQVLEAPDNHKKILILFSDGMDNSSSGRIDTTKTIYKRGSNNISKTISSRSALDIVKVFAKKNDITIYTIVYGLGFSDFESMEELANYTGGRFYHIVKGKEFPYVFADIYLTLNNYYRISYKPSPCENLHEVRLNLNFPGYDQNLSALGYYDKTILVRQDPIGTTALLNIEFDFGKATIKPASLPLINNVATALERDPDMRIKIIGHTDDIGDEEDNRKLSLARAKAVKAELKNLGVNHKRLYIKGYGETEPLVPNDSEKNRRKNRRTEFVIVGRR